MSLTGWDSESSRQKNIALPFRVTVGIVLGLVLIGGISLFFISDEEILSWIFFALFMVGIGVFGVKNHKSYDVVIFRSPTTGQQLVLHNNVPNEKEFSSFVETLKATIKKFPAIPLGQANTTIAELREFARLRDDGILNNEEFEEAKRKLLASLNSSAKIGFH